MELLVTALGDAAVHQLKFWVRSQPIRHALTQYFAFTEHRRTEDLHRNKGRHGHSIADFLTGRTVSLVLPTRVDGIRQQRGHHGLMMSKSCGEDLEEVPLTLEGVAEVALK